MVGNKVKGKNKAAEPIGNKQYTICNGDATPPDVPVLPENY